GIDPARARRLEPAMPADPAGMIAQHLVVQENVLGEVLDLSEAQGRAADRRDALEREPRVREARIAAGAVADAGVDAVAPRIDEPIVGRDAYVELGVARAKRRKVGDEPADRERRRAAHRQRGGLLLPLEPRDALSQKRERGVGLFRERAAFLRQLDAPADPSEERRPELRFERPHPMADRALRDVQLLRRPREAPVPRDRLEGLEPGQAGQAVHMRRANPAMKKGPW